MKLYIWFYLGYGEHNYYVVAESRGSAREAVERYIEERRKKYPLYAEEWGTDEYELSEYAPGEVVVIARDW